MAPVPREPKSAREAGSASALVGDLRELASLRILRSIGSGGMSEVYLAFHPGSKRQVAVKVLAEHLVSNHTFVNRFIQEGKLGKELTHPNIVKAYGYGRDEASGKYFIVMEYIEGPTAQERLERDGRLAIGEAIRIIIDIARGLEYLHHRRYVHRDIKPGNILLAPDDSAKLADLGVAKILDDVQGLTTLDQGVGTPYYMPWEQGINACLVDARSDIFALGATFYHLLTGHVPFPGDDEMEIARRKEIGDYLPARHYLPRLPDVVDTILARMLARDPRRRFASALDVVESLTASGLCDSSMPTMELPSLSPQPLAPTRADLKSHSDIDTPLEKDEQIWLLKYQRPGDGAWRKLRGRTHDIIRLYEQAILPEEVFAAREPSQVFRRLRAYPEFRLLKRNLGVAENSAPDAPLSKRRPAPKG